MSQNIPTFFCKGGLFGKGGLMIVSVAAARLGSASRWSRAKNKPAAASRSLAAPSGSAPAGAGLSAAQPWLQAIFQMRQQAASLWSFEHSACSVMLSYCREQLLGVSHGNPRTTRKSVR